MRTIDLKHNFKSNDSIYVDKEAFEYLYRVNLNVESIVLPNIGANIGEVYYIDPSKFPFPRNVLGPNAIYLIPNENIKFIYSFFQTKEFQKEIFVNVASSGQPKFNKTELKRITISLPKSKEQKCIGLYFQYLDNLITLHQRKIQLYNRFMTIVWEQRKLGELASIYDGVHKTPNYKDSGIMFLSVENIITLKSKKYISEEDFERDYKVHPERGDIFMTRIGDVGTTNVVESSEKLAFYVSLALLKPIDSYPYFLNNAMKTNDFQMKLRKRTLVTAIPQKINKDEIGKLELFITYNFVEQKKIGDYFRKLDQLITLHQWKWYFFDKKVGNAWEQRKAEELCSISTGKSNTQDQIDDGKYPFYIRSDIPVRSDKYLYDCEAVITIGDGNIGKVFHYVKGKFDLHQRCYKMADFVGIFGKYFFYYFSTKFYDRAIKMTAKATVDSVRMDMISEMDIQYPISSQEQRQIALFLERLDNLITLHQRGENIYNRRQTW